ncbi:hypothetical protein P7C70_g1781, partial [Phenoliferia sp. Uapishka_3]
MPPPNPWWNHFCPDTPPFSTTNWDLSPCLQSTLVASVPPALLFIVGGSAFPNLLRRFNAGDRPEKGGIGAYRVKVVGALGLVGVQVVYLITVALEGLNIFRDVRFTFGLLTLVALVFAVVLHLISHPLLPHSSTPLLFFDLTSLITLLISLRTTLSLHLPTKYLVLTALKISLFAFIFSVELLGPGGWDGMTWRDWFGWVPYVEEEKRVGAIRLEGEEWEQKECPRIRANIFERLTFSWLTPLMKEGYTKYLTEEDLWSLPPDDQAEALSNRLEGNWVKRRIATEERNKKLPSTAKKERASLTGALVASYGTPFFVAAIFKFLQDCLSFAQPQLLKRLLIFVASYRTDAPEPAFHGYIIALTMFTCAVTQTLLLHCYFSRVFETGMRVRAGLINIIYKKSLVLSNDERAGRLTGDIVNLQSTDSTRLQELCTYGQVAWSGIFQITLAFISLYNLLGWTMLVGVAVMIASMPLTAMIARYQTKLQRQQMKNKDKRTSIMSEILSNIRSIKLYAWEDSFAQKLLDVRNNQELVMLRKMGYLSSTSGFLWSFTPFAVAFSSFAMFSTISGKPLTSEIVFPAITLFSLLGFPLAILPVVFSSLVEAYVSIDRLTNFLVGKELQEGAVNFEVPTRELKDGDELVSVTHGEFTWDSTSAADSTLVDINLSVKVRPHSIYFRTRRLSGTDAVGLAEQKGELLAVVGRVGSGKSSLLSAILGEMTKVDGTVTVRGSVAFCNQQPWIMGGTVKTNITFGHKFDEEFYNIVIAACALKEDIAILPNGDETEVGEKGISLSGGQKARVALARAVYARADIYLLDDCLSAVDAHVGRHLFDQVLGPRGLLAGKARLLCTNAIPFCEQADELIFLRKGVILERGTYSAAVLGDTELSRLLLEYGKVTDNSDDEGDDNSGSEATVVAPTELASKLEQKVLDESLRQKASIALMKRAEVVPVSVQKRETLKHLKKSTRPKEQKEARQQGAVKWANYVNYIRANSYLGVAFYMGTILLQQGLQIGTNVWLKNWSQRNSETGNNGNLPFYLGIYAAFGLGASLVYLANGLLLYSLCVIRSAKIMHDSMFKSVMRSPMRFFETTPLGTILNRFSRDVYVIDEMLARVFGGFFRTLAGVFGMVAVISFSAPSFLIVFLPLMFVYKRIQTYYLATSRELKRLDATTRSPLFTSLQVSDNLQTPGRLFNRPCGRALAHHRHTQETLGGVATIRAYRQSERFIAENEARLDRNQEAYFPSINCNRWLAIRLEFIGSIIILATATLAVATLVRYNTVDAGIVGLMLSYALTTTQTLNWIVRSATEVETNIVSVERVQEYIELKPEAPDYIPESQPDESWPQTGSIKFQNVSARYRQDLDLVLRDVSFELKGGEKVGVCGRTGAGKSSLTMVLYRVVEPESGSVLIDDVDVGKIGLHCLRSRLSIIPQDSQCFEGEIRANLDPTGKATDAELWRALEQCHLKDHIETMDGKLDAHVDEGGSNLSAGQRQLMCLGRALLRHSKILVLDEATAAVDPESDKEIQSSLAATCDRVRELHDVRRIFYFMDCDKILVMDFGRVAEFASPAELLQDKNSIFYSLAVEAGVVRSGSGSTSANRSGVNTPSGARTPARKD